MNRVIHAGAGTGKTWRLSVEYLRLLLKMGRESGYTRYDDYPQIVVLTFTRKATAELRDRVFTFLRVLSDPQSGADEHQRKTLTEVVDISDPPAMDFLRRILRDMRGHPHRVQIHTLDAFIQSLFKGLVAPYRQIGEYRVDPASLDEAVSTTLGELLANERHFRELEEFFHHYAPKIRELAKYRKFVIDLIRLRPVIETSALESPDVSADTWCDHYREAAADYFAGLAEDLGEGWQNFLIGGFKKALKSSGRELDDSTTGWRHLLTHRFLDEHAADLLPEKLFAKKFNEKYPERAEYYRNNVYPTLELAVVTEARTATATIIRLARTIYAVYDEVRLRSRCFDHGDILGLTGRFLTDGSDEAVGMIYETLATRIRYVLLDEFQDTSVAQWNLLRPMLEETAAGEGIHSDGGFVLVGDEKQAIYGWRGGERGLLKGIADIFPAESLETETLDMCYRSLPKIVEFVNSIFTRLASGLPRIHWNYSPLHASRKDAPGWVEVCSSHYTRSKNENRPRSTVLREFVGSFVVPRIEKLGPGAEVGILTRNNADLTAIARHLTRLGYHYTLDTARSLLEHPAVVPLLSLLRWKAWGRGLDLLAFLRSSYVGLDASRFRLLLDRFRALKDSEFDADFIQQWLDGDEYLRSVRERLEPILYAQDLVTVWELALKNFGAVERFPRESDFRNLDRLLEQARQYPDPTDFPGFLDELERIRGNLPQIGSESAPGIVLLTVHKAKGLEFENLFVFLDFSSRRGGPDGGMALDLWSRYDAAFESLEDALIVAPGTRSALNSLTADRPDTAAIVALREEAKSDALAEEINNLYVALTRARDRLFVYATVESTKDKLASIGLGEEVKGLYALFTSPDLRSSGEFAEVPCAASTLETPAHPVAELWTKPLPQASGEVLSAPEREHLRIQHESNARLLGTFAHDYLARVIRAERDDLSRARGYVLTRYGTLLPPTGVQAACDLLEHWVKTNPAWFAPEWDIVLTETPIYDGDREYRIDRLQIDTTRNTLLIADYKTGPRHDQEQQEKYSRLVASLPLVREGGYTVEFQYVELEEIGSGLRKLFNNT